MKRALVLLMAVATVGIAATANAALRPASPSKALHVAKECSQYFGKAGQFCTITASNIAAIEPGMKVVYLSDLGGNGVLDTDIILSSGQSGTAAGHVVLDTNTLQGRVTLSGGTGKFTQFHADVDVSLDMATGLWHWDGTYSYGQSGPGAD
jgi:hypothetical protein